MESNPAEDQALSDSVTVKSVVDLHQQCGSDSVFLNRINELPESFSNCNSSSLCKKINEYIAKIKDLKRKKKKSQLEEFLTKTFLPPSSETVSSVGIRLVAINSTNRRELEKLKDTESQLKVTKEALIEVQKDKNELIAKTLEQHKLICNKQKTIESQESNMKKFQLSESLRKKVKRHEVKINSLKDENKDLQSQNKVLSETISKLEKTNSVQSERLQELRHQKILLQKRIHKVKCRVAQLGNDNVKKLESEVKRKSKEVEKLEEMIDFLEDKGDAPANINLFEGGRFNTEIRELCMKLLTECNVSIKKLPEVIRSVLASLTSSVVTRLPSSSTLSRMYSEAHFIASKQVATEMLDDFDARDSVGNVLHQDATTKFHRHYEAAEITLKNGEATRTVGLREVAGGDAQTYLGAITDIFDDLAMSYNMADKESAKAKLVASVKSFMNDRCAVNGVFIDKFERMREDLLPTAAPELTEEEGEDAKRMGHFSCRLHLLVNFATAAEKGAAALEDCLVDQANPFSFKRDSASEAVNMVSTSAKAFTQRGCDRSGVNSHFDAFLHGRGRTNKLITFLGHRFNVLFSNAGALYHHRQDIRDFLEQWPQPNHLLQSIAHDINEPIYIAIVRALGIIGCTITCPLQKLMQWSDTKILDMNDHLQTVHKVLSDWSVDGSLALSSDIIYPKLTVTDEVYSSLFAKTDNATLDSDTQVAVEIICLQLLVILERQASEQLSGGALCSLSDKEENTASNVPASNLASERDMAKLDNLVRIMPSASTATLESIIMWQTNKPSSWLASLSAEEKAAVFTDAQKSRKEWSLHMKSRREKLILDKQLKLVQKQSEKTTKEEKSVAAKLAATDTLQEYGGLWKIHNIDQQLEGLSVKSAKKAIMAQKKFLKLVIGVTGVDKTLFNETVGGRAYSLSELKDQLTKILEASNTPQDLPTNQENAQRTDKTEMVEKKKDTIKMELEIERKKRLNKKQCSENLQDFLKDPPSVIGRSCEVFMPKAKCPGGERQWVRGIIRDISNINDDALRCKFLFSTESFGDFTLPLFGDMKKGNVIFV